MQHKLRSKQLKAIQMLASGYNDTAIARALKLRRETLWRWKQIPEFRDEIQKLISNMRDNMRHRLLNLAGTSIATLEKEIKNGFAGSANVTKTALKVLQLLGAGSVLASEDIVYADTSMESARANYPPVRHAVPQIRSLGGTVNSPSGSAPPVP